MRPQGQRCLPLIVVCLLSTLSPTFASPSRIKDIAAINGLGRHKLLGYGIVAGLQGTGDSDDSMLTIRSIANMLQSFGVTVGKDDFSGKNLAAVIVTAEMPPITAVGSTIDVTVSSLSDAKSLQGGTLLLTPLRAADGEVYAVAQGAVTIGGFSAETRGGDVAQKNHPTVGRVPNGASLVKALAGDLNSCEKLSLALLQPDFTTAARIAEAINQAQGQPLAVALDNATVQVTVPEAARRSLTTFIVSLENLPIEPDNAARVVINERTGTVVIGQHVRIMPVAICHGGLTVEVKSRTEVSQPPPVVEVVEGPTKAAEADKDVRAPHGERVSGGRTVVVEQEELQVQEAAAALVAIEEQATLHDLVTALNALGVKPRDLIAIIQALKEAGALRAELVLF
ncbi:MAG: flagellar basal body P-ring protein FlgI [Armatimonadia bacterium]